MSSAKIEGNEIRVLWLLSFGRHVELTEARKKLHVEASLVRSTIVVTVAVGYG